MLNWFKPNYRDTEKMIKRLLYASSHNHGVFAGLKIYKKFSKQASRLSIEELDYLNDNLLRYEWSIHDVLALTTWRSFIYDCARKKVQGQSLDNNSRLKGTFYILNHLLSLNLNHLLPPEAWAELLPEFNKVLKNYLNSKNMSYDDFREQVVPFMDMSNDLLERLKQDPKWSKVIPNRIPS